VGVFEIISEFVKILSLSFRLFGNILAGEVLILVILSLFPLFIPIFFTGIEMFVGFIQAFLFFVLTSIFLKVALSQDH
jgi:F-type H+-transporting ATPase subunit a